MSTDFGWVGFGYNELGLRRVELSRVSSDQAKSNLVSRLGSGIVFARPERGSALGALPDKLTAYFAGQRVEFDEPVDLEGLTPFQRGVLAATREIPYGEVRSYSNIAQIIGNPRASRAVGQSLGRNPVAIVIPCHRVVTSQGTLGGFSWGLDIKEALLSLERGGIKRPGKETSYFRAQPGVETSPKVVGIRH